MLEADTSEEDGRTRSKHAPASVSLLTVARSVDDPVARHRIARSRREARPNPLLSALSAFQEPAAPDESRPAQPAAADDGTPAADSIPAAEIAGATAGEPPAPTQPAVADEPAEQRELTVRADAAGHEGRTRRDEPAASSGHGQPFAWFGPMQQPAKEPARPVQPVVVADGGDDRWKPLIDPMMVLKGVARSKLLIAATTVAGALIGVAIAVTTPKLYSSSTELLVDPRDLKLVDRDLTQSGLPSDATLAIVENQARVLMSGSVLNKVVERLHLDKDPEFNGQDGGFDLMSSIRSLFSRGGSGGNEVSLERALATAHLAESLSVERGGRTFVIVIKATTQDPDKSALIANTMTDVFMSTYGQLQSDAAGRATTELTSRLDELRNSVEEAERKVETFKAEKDIIDPQGRMISDDEIVSLNNQLSTARARTAELNARAASVRDVDVDAVLGGSLPEQLSSSVLSELRTQYATLKQEADRQAIRLGPRHPERQALGAQLAAAREQIGAELRRSVASVQVELKRAVQLEQELAGRLAQLKVRQGTLGGDLVTLRELERESAAKRSVYEAFLLRARETSEQQDINTANMSVISPAYPPLLARPPSRTTIAGTGAVLGFVFGIAAGATRGAFDSLRQTSAAMPTRRRRRRGRPDDGAEDRTDGSDGGSEPASPAGDIASRSDSPEISNLSPEDQTMQQFRSAAAAPFQSPQPAQQPYQQAQPAPQYYGQPAPQAPFYAQPQFYGQPQPGPYQPAPQPYGQPQAAPQFYAQPAPYGYAQPAPQPYQHAQQPMPMQPMQQPYYAPAYAQPAPMGPVPVQAAEARAEEAKSGQSAIDEIRESLREFREAVRELAESRSRRRFF